MSHTQFVPTSACREMQAAMGLSVCQSTESTAKQSETEAQRSKTTFAELRPSGRQSRCLQSETSYLAADNPVAGQDREATNLSPLLTLLTLVSHWRRFVLHPRVVIQLANEIRGELVKFSNRTFRICNSDPTVWSTLEGIQSTLSSDSQDHAELFEVVWNWLMDRLAGWKTKHLCKVTL